MTFSFLRSYAAKQKDDVLRRYLPSFCVYIGLSFSLLSPVVVVQLSLVYLNLAASIINMLLLCFSETILLKTLHKKKYSLLVDYVREYNFRAKYGVFSTLYSCVGVILVLANMLVLGWLWQPIVFIFCTLVGYLAANKTLDNLPAIVNQFDLKEEDFQ